MTSIQALTLDYLEKLSGLLPVLYVHHFPLQDFLSGGEKERNKERKYNEKGAFISCVSGNNNCICPEKDSLNTQKVEEVVMTASRKKREY